MSDYRSPGIYVVEVPSAIKPIAGVSTSTAGFIGLVPNTINQICQDPEGGKATPKWRDFRVPTDAGTARLITNWTQFTSAFGDIVFDPTDITVKAAGALDPGHANLARAVYGFFHNGGSRCWVVRITGVSELDRALRAFAPIDEIALVAAPGLVSKEILNGVADDCKKTERFAILDGPETAAVPALDPLAQPSSPPSPQSSPPSTPVATPQRTDYAAWYFPWIRVFDPATKLRVPDGDGLVAVPPSGHIAGVYARVDAERGVHKAPGNEALLGALGVTQAISRPEQDDLNPNGVNCIRELAGNVLVWGARTVGGDRNGDLKYINVRRTLLFLRKSIEQGTQWVVFEPNDPGLWQRITRNITAFLMTVWRSGALFGTTAAEAFYVKCDRETNPAELRDLGRVVTEIGVAIVRPAEFVIFRISQFTAPGA
jgi:hypothetical protein